LGVKAKGSFEMVKRNAVLLASSLLVSVLVAVGLAGCADDSSNLSTQLDCNSNPTAVVCQNPCVDPNSASCLAFCASNPTAAVCQTPCQIDPSSALCKTFCLNNPTAAVCLSHCEAVPTDPICTVPQNPTSLLDCDPANPNATFKPLKSLNVSTAVSGICLNCVSASPVSAFDGNLNTYAVNTAQVGLLDAIDLNGYDTTAQARPLAVPTGTYRTGGFFVAYPKNSVADAALLASAQANLLNGSGAVIPLTAPSSNPPNTDNALTLVGTPVTIPGLTNSTTKVTFVPVYSFQQPFKGLQLKFAPTIAAIGELNVIEACVQK
jgi:hypothetical protein